MSDLLTLWRRANDRLNRRLGDLSDDEYFWQPVPNSWTVYQADDRWTYDYEFPPPRPAPVTTISWRLMHIAANNWIYWDYAFGTASMTFSDLTVPSTARDAIANWHHSSTPIIAWLAEATESELDEMRPNHLGADLPARSVVSILVDELIHHGAEIALLRDLYLRQRAEP